MSVSSVRIDGFRIAAGFISADHELRHQPLVLVKEKVTVDHVRVLVIDVVLESHHDPVGAARFQIDGVLPSQELRPRRLPVDVEDLELHVVNMPVVREQVSIGDPCAELAGREEHPPGGVPPSDPYPGLLRGRGS